MPVALGSLAGKRAFSQSHSSFVLIVFPFGFPAFDFPFTGSGTTDKRGLNSTTFAGCCANTRLPCVLCSPMVSLQAIEPRLATSEAQTESRTGRTVRTVSRFSAAPLSVSLCTVEAEAGLPLGFVLADSLLTSIRCASLCASLCGAVREASVFPLMAFGLGGAIERAR